MEEDKVKFGITESDFEITAMSKEKFKSTIREKTFFKDLLRYPLAREGVYA